LSREKSSSPSLALRLRPPPLLCLLPSPRKQTLRSSERATSANPPYPMEEEDAQRRLRAVAAHLQPPATTAAGREGLAANPTAGQYVHGASLLLPGSPHPHPHPPRRARVSFISTPPVVCWGGDTDGIARPVLPPRPTCARFGNWMALLYCGAASCRPAPPVAALRRWCWCGNVARRWSSRSRGGPRTGTEEVLPSESGGTGAPLVSVCFGFLSQRQFLRTATTSSPL
jgi:hypothetical protein